MNSGMRAKPDVSEVEVELRQKAPASTSLTSGMRAKPSDSLLADLHPPWKCRWFGHKIRHVYFYVGFTSPVYERCKRCGMTVELELEPMRPW